MAEIKISLAAARANKNLTINDVAEKMHVSNKTIINWEKGRVSPSFATLQTLSQIYEIPLDNIILPGSAT